MMQHNAHASRYLNKKDGSTSARISTVTLFMTSFARTAATTSRPLTTRPQTVGLPVRCGWGEYVMKNRLPLVRS